MKDLLDKLSSYNVFNYLLPGIIFVVLAESVTSFRFVQNDIVLGMFFYYFIGLVISRIGSVIIEPIMKWCCIIRFSPYEEYVKASKDDKHLEILSEANNMYRTLLSLFVSLGFLCFYDFAATKFPIIKHWSAEISAIAFIFLFGFAYRKQTQYITKRISSGGRGRNQK